MNNLNPKAAIAFTVLAVLLAGLVIFKTVAGSRPGTPPPIASGGPSPTAMELPGKETASRAGGPAISGANGGGGAPPMAAGGMTLPGGGGGMSAPMPGGH